MPGHLTGVSFRFKTHFICLICLGLKELYTKEILMNYNSHQKGLIRLSRSGLFRTQREMQKYGHIKCCILIKK